MRIPLRPIAIGALLALLVVPTANAQIGRVLDRAKNRAEENLNRRMDRETDKIIDGAIACVLGDVQCVEDAKNKGQPVVITTDDGNVIKDSNGNPVTDQGVAANMQEQPGEGVWRNYDFVPGDSIWFATDWEHERTGRIPASQIEFVSGNLEIIERTGKKLLEAKSRSVFRVRLDATLPEQFTVEFMLETGAPHMRSWVRMVSQENGESRYEWDYLRFQDKPGIYRQNESVSSTPLRTTVDNLTPIKLQVDGGYAILYVGSTRAAQVPNANFPRGDMVEFELGASPEYPAYISDIVVSVGLDPLYDGLMRTGEVTTYGFLFDVDSDKLRPESSPKLNELLEMMEDHEDLKLEIVGHTDATGDDDHNQDLSEQRAESVVDWLKDQGISGGRLDATGMGEADPVGDNETPAGRQQNRRVVLKRVE